ncbi:GGDEF domain-containing protein [Mycoplasmatota bacterium WC30]
MNFYDSFVLNIYSFILLMILFITIYVKKEGFKYSSRLLRGIIGATCIMLVIEILSWTFDGIDASYARVFNYFFNAVFFVLGTAVVGLFACYVDYMNFKSRERLKQRFYYMHVFVFSLVLITINFFYPIVFSINAVNVYQREPFMMLGFISTFLLLGYILIMTYRNRKNIEKQILLSTYVFLLVPFIGGLLQMLFFGILIMWAFVGLGVVIAYIYTETISNSKDYLTKLYTRLIANEYLEHLLHQNETLTLILFDLDDFKEINDNFGHKEGDNVLIAFAHFLRLTAPIGATISRIGGDEFLVMYKGDTDYEISYFLSKLKDKTHMYNKAHKDIEIKYSVGYTCRKKDGINDADELFILCDKLMYKEKAVHKGN